jgi:hypothetical protein
MVTIPLNGLALNQLHDEIGSAIFRGTPIEEARNVRMIEAGQNLPLVLEAADHKRRILSPAHHFERDLLAVLIVGADGTIHLTHTTDTNLFDNLVCPNSPARQFLSPVSIVLAKSGRDYVRF